MKVDAKVRCYVVQPIDIDIDVFSKNAEFTRKAESIVKVVFIGVSNGIIVGIIDGNVDGD